MGRENSRHQSEIARVCRYCTYHLVLLTVSASLFSQQLQNDWANFNESNRFILATQLETNVSQDYTRNLALNISYVFGSFPEQLRELFYSHAAAGRINKRNISNYSMLALKCNQPSVLEPYLGECLLVKDVVELVWINEVTKRTNVLIKAGTRLKTFHKVIPEEYYSEEYERHEKTIFVPRGAVLVLTNSRISNIVALSREDILMLPLPPLPRIVSIVSNAFTDSRRGKPLPREIFPYFRYLYIQHRPLLLSISRMDAAIAEHLYSMQLSWSSGTDLIQSTAGSIDNIQVRNLFGDARPELLYASHWSGYHQGSEDIYLFAPSRTSTTNVFSFNLDYWCNCAKHTFTYNITNRDKDSDIEIEIHHAGRSNSRPHMVVDYKGNAVTQRKYAYWDYLTNGIERMSLGDVDIQGTNLTFIGRDILVDNMLISESGEVSDVANMNSGLKEEIERFDEDVVPNFLAFADDCKVTNTHARVCYASHGKHNDCYFAWCHSKAVHRCNGDGVLASTRHVFSSVAGIVSDSKGGCYVLDSGDRTARWLNPLCEDTFVATIPAEPDRSFPSNPRTFFGIKTDRFGNIIILESWGEKNLSTTDTGYLYRIRPVAHVSNTPIEKLIRLYVNNPNYTKREYYASLLRPFGYDAVSKLVRAVLAADRRFSQYFDLLMAIDEKQFLKDAMQHYIPLFGDDVRAYIDIVYAREDNDFFRKYIASWDAARFDRLFAYAGIMQAHKRYADIYQKIISDNMLSLPLRRAVANLAFTKEIRVPTDLLLKLFLTEVDEEIKYYAAVGLCYEKRPEAFLYLYDILSELNNGAEKCASILTQCEFHDIETMLAIFRSSLSNSASHRGDMPLGVLWQARVGEVVARRESATKHIDYFRTIITNTKWNENVASVGGNFTWRRGITIDNHGPILSDIRQSLSNGFSTLSFRAKDIFSDWCAASVLIPEIGYEYLFHFMLLGTSVYAEKGFPSPDPLVKITNGVVSISSIPATTNAIYLIVYDEAGNPTFVTFSNGTSISTNVVPEGLSYNEPQATRSTLYKLNEKRSGR